MKEEQQNIPEIRFKEFAGNKTNAWEQRKLGEVVTVNSGRDYKHLNSGDIPVYGTGGYMLSVDQALSNTKDGIGIGRKGTIDSPYILRAPFWTVDTLFYAIPNANNLNFLYSIFQRINWKKMDESTGVPSLSKENINKAKIKIPGILEQQKIGNFFKQLDSLITLQQRKLEQFQTLKKTMLSKLFLKNDEKHPEIRFKNFTDAWEQRRISECFDERINRSKNGELISVTINEGIKKARDLDRKDNSSRNKSNYKVVEVGDIAYNSMRMWQGASGYSPYKGIVSPAYTVLAPKKGIDSKFFASYFKRSDIIWIFRINSQGLTSDTWNLKYPALSKISVRVPSYEEQQKISTFFEKLDSLITLHQRKLEELEMMKKTLLRQMFV